MNLGRNKAVNQLEEAFNRPVEHHEEAREDPQHEANKPCTDCDGKGVNMAVSDTDLCATCNGSGSV